MNAGRFAALPARIVPSLQLSGYRDYIILQAIRLGDRVALYSVNRKSIKSKPTRREYDMFEISKRKCK